MAKKTKIYSDRATRFQEVKIHDYCKVGQRRWWRHRVGRVAQVREEQPKQSRK
jgi:hypothetical protein